MDNIMESKVKRLGLSLTDRQQEQFDTYYRILVEWNKVMNLTGIQSMMKSMKSTFWIVL